jgi:hypothetical protein
MNFIAASQHRSIARRNVAWSQHRISHVAASNVAKSHIAHRSIAALNSAAFR